MCFFTSILLHSTYPRVVTDSFVKLEPGFATENGPLKLVVHCFDLRVLLTLKDQVVFSSSK